MTDLAPPSPVDERSRASPRESLLLIALFRTADGSREGVLRLRNLSAGGMMADQSPPLPAGTKLDLRIRGVGRVGAAVVWSEQDRIGVAFTGPVNPRLARKPVGGVSKDARRG